MEIISSAFLSYNYSVLFAVLEPSCYTYVMDRVRTKNSIKN